MKKIIKILALTGVILTFSACGDKPQEEVHSSSTTKKEIEEKAPVKTVDINTKLTQEEQDIGNKVIKKYNQFLQDLSHPISLLEEAIAAKNDFTKRVEHKKETLAAKAAFQLLEPIPLYKQFCVTAVVTKNSPKVDECVKQLDLMDKESDNQYAITSKEVFYEHLVIYFWEERGDSDMSEKIAYRMLKIYPNNKDTLSNLSILYAKTKADRFENETERNCYAFYLATKAGKNKEIFSECKDFDGDSKFNEISQNVLHGVLLQKNKIGFDK